MSDEVDLARARKFMRAMDERSAETIVDLGWGTALFNASLPGIWDLNFVLVDGPTDLEPKDVFARVDRLQGEVGLLHRKLYVDHDEEGGRLRSGAGTWESSRHVIMAKHRPADRDIDTSNVVELPWSEIRPFVREVNLESASDKDPAGMGQLLDHHEVTQRAIPTRYFAARVDGELAADCELYSDGTIAQIEDVSTLERFRRRGLARAVVQKATDIALDEGHELVFLVADAHDFPRELYGKLGYDPIGYSYEFMKKPPGM